MTEEAKNKRDDLAHSRGLNIELKAKRLGIQPKVYENASRSFQKGFDAGYQVAMDEANERIKKLREALEFYAPADSYDYDKVQGTNYIWNDQGKTAREALKEDDLKST